MHLYTSDHDPNIEDIHKFLSIIDLSILTQDQGKMMLDKPIALEELFLIKYSVKRHLPQMASLLSSTNNPVLAIYKNG